MTIDDREHLDALRVVRVLGNGKRRFDPSDKELPEDYEFAEWRLARAGVDYHVEYAAISTPYPMG